MAETTTGRGGAGNMVHDDPRKYVDGSIVREGHVGESAEGDYSSGRGGAGNIVPSPRVKPQENRRGSQDRIPDEALAPVHSKYHVGRGGEGNVHKDHPAPHKTLIEKAKKIIHPEDGKDK